MGRPQRHARGERLKAQMDIRTRLIRDATARPQDRRPVNPPIERGTTILMSKSADLFDESRGVTYGLSGLSVHRALEKGMAELEAAEAVFLASSGLAAVTIPIMAMLGAGDEVLVTDAVYGPTRRFCNQTMKRFGVATRYYPQRATPEEVLALAGDKTRLIILESPGSLTFEIQDIPGIARLAKARGIATLIDNTWGAGLLFRPLEHGVDISVQALSKYVGGHSDVFLGSIAVRDAAIGRRINEVVEQMGWFVSPDDAYLALRGLRTLPARMAQHEAGGLSVARWLADQPQVVSVLHPALPDFPDHGLWKRDFSGSNGLFGIVLKPGLDADRLIDALELFGTGVSWGGYESLASPGDRQVARRSLPQDLGGSLVRLHVGLEAPEDLIADLGRGLNALYG
jgi:cystathionine beta-lyase